MAAHIPFLAKRGVRYGLSPRMAIHGFFESMGFAAEEQEKYYRWWYEWTKNYVMNDPDLKATKGVYFNGYPMGQHAEHEFHLHDQVWATRMAELGDLVRDTIVPKLSEEDFHKLEQDHEKLIEQLKKDAEQNPRQPAPEVGYFKHV